MSRTVRWAEIDPQLVGLAILTALTNLERGEIGEVDLELPTPPERFRICPTTGNGERFERIESRWLRVAIDAVNGRVVIFEIQKPLDLTEAEREDA